MYFFHTTGFRSWNITFWGVRSPVWLLRVRQGPCLVLTHLTHPWGPPWTLATLGEPWRPLATCLKMTNFPQNPNRHTRLQSTFVANKNKCLPIACIGLQAFDPLRQNLFFPKSRIPRTALSCQHLKEYLEFRMRPKKCVFYLKYLSVCRITNNWTIRLEWQGMQNYLKVAIIFI